MSNTNGVNEQFDISDAIKHAITKDLIFKLNGNVLNVLEIGTWVSNLSAQQGKYREGDTVYNYKFTGSVNIAIPKEGCDNHEKPYTIEGYCMVEGENVKSFGIIKVRDLFRL